MHVSFWQGMCNRFVTKIHPIVSFYLFFTLFLNILHIGSITYSGNILAFSILHVTYSVYVRFWRGMYNRFETGIHPRDEMKDILSAARDHTSSLEDHVRLLEKVIYLHSRCL